MPEHIVKHSTLFVFNKQRDKGIQEQRLHENGIYLQMSYVLHSCVKISHQDNTYNRKIILLEPLSSSMST